MNVLHFSACSSYQAPGRTVDMCAAAIPTSVKLNPEVGFFRRYVPTSVCIPTCVKTTKLHSFRRYFAMYITMPTSVKQDHKVRFFQGIRSDACLHVYQLVWRAHCYVHSGDTFRCVPAYRLVWRVHCYVHSGDTLRCVSLHHPR